MKRENSPFKNVAPKVSDKFETGAIIYDRWGWEQTNIDFYCIVKRSGDYVTILRMKQQRGEEIGFMTNEENPLEIDFTADPIKKKVKGYEGKETGFSLTGGGWCGLWDGKPKTSTHYA